MTEQIPADLIEAATHIVWIAAGKRGDMAVHRETAKAILRAVLPLYRDQLEVDDLIESNQTWQEVSKQVCEAVGVTALVHVPDAFNGLRDQVIDELIAALVAEKGATLADALMLRWLNDKRSTGQAGRVVVPRELLEPSPPDVESMILSQGSTRQTVPCPTCSGPVRQTVGMVCQTCGTDYGVEQG